MNKFFRILTIVGVFSVALNLMAEGNHAGHHQPPVIESYLSMQSKLASDSLISKEEIKDFKAKALLTKNADLMGAIDDLETQKDIDGQRESFKSISKHLITYAKREKLDGLYEANCPMASADWLQSTSEVKNPYYGAKMLTCGSAKKI